MASATYPVQLAVDGPAPQRRLTVLFRILMVLPHAVVIALLGIVAAVIYVVSWFAILFTGTYPAGMMNFMVGFMHWSTRFTGYALLLTDRYPPFALGAQDSYPVRLSLEGQLNNRNRLTTFWPVRLIMAIPHLIILYVLQYVASVVALIAWVIALITGTVPAGLHNFLAGYLRWSARANAYVYNLVDEYPPFSLS